MRGAEFMYLDAFSRWAMFDKIRALISSMRSNRGDFRAAGIGDVEHVGNLRPSV